MDAIFFMRGPGGIKVKIDSSAIGMESKRSSQSVDVRMRKYVVEQYSGSIAEDLLQSAGGGDTGETDAENAKDDKTDDKTTSLQDWQAKMQSSVGKVSIRRSEGQMLTNIHQITVRYIFELLFGGRMRRFRDWEPNNTSNANGQNQMQSTSTNASVRVLTYSQETYHYECENTSFSTMGTVRTADGREISFNINVEMSRSFESYFREDLQLASFTLCDPLVINLDGNVADLDDQTFFFDIDADGELDEISGLGRGSGFLALDRNGDGIINDGSELFGTRNGNGFADLAQYDEDGNGWIDENDPIWSKLKIWCKDENGNDVLYRLADKGVGAICLQNVSTDFTMQGTGGKTQGVVRNTGIFLYENGLAGTIQHVDVAKYDVGA